MDDVEAPVVEEPAEGRAVHDGPTGLLREPDGDRSEPAGESLDDDAVVDLRRNRCVVAGERAVRVVVAHHGDVMTGAHQRASERLHGHGIAAEAARRIERGDHAEAKRRHETAGTGAARRASAATSLSAESVARALARQVRRAERS